MIPDSSLFSAVAKFSTACSVPDFGSFLLASFPRSTAPVPRLSFQDTQLDFLIAAAAN
jgi:hypothetical protein